jgi:hypothetical protein
MTLDKKTKMALLSIVCSATAIFLAANWAKALEPGKVQLDKDFPQKVLPYVLTQPVVAGPFTGGKETDMEEILPYYTSPLSKFDLSVQTAGQKQSYEPGDTVNLKGNISYSLDPGESQKALESLKGCKEGCPSTSLYHFSTLPDTGVFAQIWRKDDDKTQSAKGDYLVDEFYAAEKLNLMENTSKEFTIAWKVPEELKDGDYYFFFFANSAKRFTLAGSPLVPLNQAAVYDFKVTGASNGSGLELDKNNININSKSYVYRQPAPEIQPDNGKIIVTVPLSNLSSETRDIKVTYNLYGWGQEDPTDLVDSKQENKTIASGDKSILEYAFNPSETGSVYNLEIKVAGFANFSTSNIRFVVKGQNRGIFRFLGQAQDTAGKLLPVFCLRNAAWTGLFHGKVKIAAYDRNGNSLNAFEKEGSMRPDDRCFVIKDLGWLKNGSAVKLTGEIYNDAGAKVDEKTVNLVSPNKIGSFEAAKQNQGTLTGVIANKIQVILLSLLVVFLVIGGYLILLRSKKQP